MFDRFFFTLVFLLVVITCVNAYFVSRLGRQHPDLFDRLGRPTLFFFATGGWLTSRAFTRFLLSKEPATLLSTDTQLRWVARLLAVLYILMLLAILGAVGSVLLNL
jgi:hypothetical protein